MLSLMLLLQLCPILKELLLDAILEVAIDKAGDLLPVDVAAFRDAARALTYNDSFGFVAAAVNILDNYFPIATTVDTFIEAVKKLVDINSVWKVLSKMEQFGQDFVEKFVDTLKNIVGKNWYEKITWKKNDGAIVDGAGAGDGINFFEKLAQLLGLDMDDMLSNTLGLGNDELIFKDFLINGFPAEIKYYEYPHGSSSSPCPTIAIKVGNLPTFKIRFC